MATKSKKPSRAPIVANPAGGQLGEHLIDLHGIPSAVVAEATYAELILWHAGEHAHRIHKDHEFLHHRHPAKGEDAAEVVDAKVQALMARAASHAKDSAA